MLQGFEPNFWLWRAKVQGSTESLFCVDLISVSLSFPYPFSNFYYYYSWLIFAF